MAIPPVKILPDLIVDGRIVKRDVDGNEIIISSNSSFSSSVPIYAPNLTGSLSSSFATTSSYALTAAYAENAGSGLTFVSSSGNITGSGLSGNEIRLKDNISLTSVTASSGFSGNLIGTASFANNATSASFAANSLTASYILNSVSASFANNATSASFATTASFAANAAKLGGLDTSNFAILSASNIFNGNQTISGNLDVLGTVTVNELHITYVTSSIIYTSGSTKFGDTADDTHQFTGSLFVSGNITANQFIGTASYATNTLSASFASSATTASFANNATSASFASTASSGFIGQAEDSDYTDGLFTDFTTTTPIGTAIDRFNEVLKGLAPAAAPSLSVIEKTSGATGTNMKLAFGASAPVSGYTSVTASSIIGSTLANVDIAGTYSSINGSGGSPIRMAVYAAPIALTMSLNNATTADAGAYTNYPAKAFNVSTDGIGSYRLEVNGTEITPTGSTSTTSSTNTTTFTLTAANTASFIGSGQGFSLFRNRTGTVGIPTSTWRNGHNYAKVTHVSSVGTHVTNYIDWVYDPSAAAGTDVYTFTTPTSASFSATGVKYLSGVKYYTGATYNFSTTVGNFYKNVYPTAGGLTFGSVTSGMSAASVTIPTPTSNTDNISISSLHTLNGSVRILGSTLASSLTANNGMGKTGTSTLTTNTILYDGINTSNTTTSENFCLENYRASSGSYDTQSSASSAVGNFSSSASLTAGELAVYNGALRYPTQILNSGNVSGSGVVHMISGQPNYAGVSDDRYFYRVFQNGASAVATFTLTINGGSGINVVTYNTTLNANNVRIWVKVPGKTGWRDVSTATPAPGYSPLADNLGALQGSKTTTSTSSTHTINLLTEGLGVSEYLLIRVQASSAWTNNISSIAITGL